MSRQSSDRKDRQSSGRKSRQSRSRKGRSIQTELENYINEELTRLHGSACRMESDAAMALTLELRAEEDHTVIAMTPSLQEQVRDQLREMNVRLGAYRPGAVYCYLDESVECVHSRPGSPSEVMAEYLPNGIPEWRDLRDVLIDENPAAAAALFESRDFTTAVYMRGRDIKNRLLSSFGKSSRTYNILGQIICGFFTLKPSEISDQRVNEIALTIQAVEYRDNEGGMRLGLNVISGFDAPHLLDHFTGTAYSELRTRILDTERRLKSIEQTLRSVPASRKSAVLKEEMPRIPSFMREIRQDVIKLNQRRHRRTGHAVNRSLENRPVFTAIEDLRTARMADILEDPRNRTLIVPGRRRRWHVFSREGRLVTTLILERDNVHHRLAKKRWRVAETAVVDAFIRAIRGLYPEPFRRNEDSKE